MVESVQSEPQAVAFLDDSLARFARRSFFGGLFATGDADRAAMFSKGRVLHYELPASTLASLVRAGRAYIGLEKIGEDVSVELGFFGATRGGSHDSAAPDGVQSLSGSFREATENSSGQLFN